MSLDLFKYTNLIKKSTPYARKMRALSHQIFGEPPPETNSKSMRVVNMYAKEPLYKDDYIVNYYPRHVELGHLMTLLRDYGLYRDEHQDFKEEMERLRELRGKVRFGSGKKRERKLIETTKN